MIKQEAQKTRSNHGAHNQTRMLVAALAMAHAACVASPNRSIDGPGNRTSGASSCANPSQTTELQQLGSQKATNAIFASTITLNSEGNIMRANATSMTATVGSVCMTLQDYLKQYPNMEVVRYWMWFTEIGDHTYLRNPRYSSRDPNSMLFIAELLSDGKGGYMAVRATWQKDGYMGAILDRNGNVDASNLLFYTDSNLRPRMNTVEETSLINANKEFVAGPSDYDTSVIHRPGAGKVTVAMFAVPREKVPSAPASSATTK